MFNISKLSILKVTDIMYLFPYKKHIGIPTKEFWKFRIQHMFRAPGYLDCYDHQTFITKGATRYVKSIPPNYISLESTRYAGTV